MTTRIGHFVGRVWSTQAIRPGVIALSHHMGRWRLTEDAGNRWASGTVDLGRTEDGIWRMRHAGGIEPFESDDPDSSRIYWEDPGVHQNLTFPVQPDPWSGMHCWLQHVRLSKAEPGDRYGDIEVDTAKSREVYREWLALTRPGPNAEGLRRPEFLMRPVKPRRKAFRVDVRGGAAVSLLGARTPVDVEAVRAAAGAVTEPQLQVGLAELGLVRDVTTDRRGDVRCLLTAVSTEGAAAERLRADVSAAVGVVDGVRRRRRRARRDGRAAAAGAGPPAARAQPSSGRARRHAPRCTRSAAARAASASRR